jgi:hypothetical protein
MTRGLLALSAAVVLATATGCCEYDRVTRVQGSVLYDLHAAIEGEFRLEDCELQDLGEELVVTPRREVEPEAQITPNACWAAALSMVANYHGISVSQTTLMRSQTAVEGCEIEGEGMEVNRIRRVRSVRDASGRVGTILWLSRRSMPAALRRHLVDGPAIWVRRTAGPRDGHAYVITGARFRVSEAVTRLVDVQVIDPSDGRQTRVSCSRLVRDTLEIGAMSAVTAGAELRP